MGVEYTHGLFVADTKWRPAWSHVDQIDAVLKRAGFRRGGHRLEKGTYYALTEGRADHIDEAAARAMPSNLMVAYDTLKGKRVTEVVGPSKYPTLRDRDRYIMDTILYLGADYKVVQVEGEEVEVTTRPKTGRKAVDRLDDAVPYDMTVYPATWTTTRPKTDGPKNFDRVWRCGLILDCHKDVPAIADDGGKLPDRAFVRALEKAFGTKLVELGWLH